MNIPFLLFEMDFDAELFRKYYGSIDNPGVYAIPEDEVEPGQPEEENQDQQVQQQPQEQDQSQQQNPEQQPFNLQFNQDELAIADREIEPIKKIFLLNKLSELNKLLAKQNTTCNELETIIKFGSSLSYKTLQVLSTTVIQQIEAYFAERKQQEEQPVSSEDNQEQPIDDTQNDNSNEETIQN